MGNTRSEGWETWLDILFFYLVDHFSYFGHKNKEPQLQTIHLSNLYMNVTSESKGFYVIPLSFPLVLSHSISGHVNLQEQWKILCQICMHNDLHMARTIWFPKKLARVRTHSPADSEIRVIRSLWHRRTHTFNFICPFALYSINLHLFALGSTLFILWLIHTI